MPDEFPKDIIDKIQSGKIKDLDIISFKKF